MKIKILLIAFLFTQTILQSQDLTIEKIEPPHWWVGMESQNLQLMLYGNDVALCTPEINYEGVDLLEIITVENPNYLFLNLRISKEAKPGIMNIVIKIGNRLIPPKQFELKQREVNSLIHQGFDQSDVVYLITPDRFSNGNASNDNPSGMLEPYNRNNPNGRHGGDLVGIKNHLDYIHELGASTILLNSILENNNPEHSYHGNNVTDFYKIDPRFGSNNEYVEFVKSAHQKDLKIIMGMIFNHASINNYLILDLPESLWIHQFPENIEPSGLVVASIRDPYASEYDLKRMSEGVKDENRVGIDQHNELMATYLIQNSIWWIEESGIDGVYIESQAYSFKEFITKWAERVFLEYPNFNVIGETLITEVAINAYFQKGNSNIDGYNSNIPCVTDFPMQLAIQKALNEKDGLTTGLSRLYSVLAHDFLYNVPGNTFIFTDNHTLNRFFSTVDNDIKKWKMGMAFLLTTRGIPMIYYGTEMLISGTEKEGSIAVDFPGGWPDDVKNAFNEGGRTNEQQQAFDFLKKLLSWRNNTPAIYEGYLKQFVPENEVYVYFRYNEDQCIMIILNNSENQVKALNTARFNECMKTYRYAIDILSGENINYLDVLTLSPKSVTILELKK